MVMAKYLADTNVLIDHLRHKEGPATSFLLEYKPTISATTVAELIEGSKDGRELKNVERLCGSLMVLPIDLTTCKTAISLMYKFFLSHNLKFMDALIAATTLEHRLTLVTANVKHFSFIKGLKLIDWKKMTVDKVL